MATTTKKDVFMLNFYAHCNPPNVNNEYEKKSRAGRPTREKTAGTTIDKALLHDGRAATNNNTNLAIGIDFVERSGHFQVWGNLALPDCLIQPDLENLGSGRGQVLI